MLHSVSNISISTKNAVITFKLLDIGESSNVSIRHKLPTLSSNPLTTHYTVKIRKCFAVSISSANGIFNFLEITNSTGINPPNIVILHKMAVSYTSDVFLKI